MEKFQMQTLTNQFKKKVQAKILKLQAENPEHVQIQLRFVGCRLDFGIFLNDKI
jgi:hypothetical protein